MQFVTFRRQTPLVLVATQQPEVHTPCKQLSIHPPPRNNHQHARFAGSLKRALSACTLGLLLSACGGGDWSSSESAQAEDGKARALSGGFGVTYSRVAVEGASFTVVGTRTVRYGSGNSWVTKEVTGTGQCSNAFFGFDPIYGVVKTCEVRDIVTPPPTGTWTQVAVEGGSFVTAGPQTVRYGAGSTWIEQIVNGAGQCTNAFFGRDPLFLVAKRCEVFNAAVPPTVTWTQIAVENGAFTVVGTQTVRFGSGNNWIEKLVTGAGQCSLAFFGSDPLYGVVKKCELRSSTTVAPVAPSIVTAPLSQTIAVGQNGLFVVAASGSDPLTYQWFKNGTAIAGANGSDVLVLANAADAGGTYQITVQVSNSAGSVTSAAAVMSIALAPPNSGGTLITAAEGGEVVGGSTGEEASLYVAPGALSANTTILLTTEPLAPSSLPAGVTAMSDIVEIKPAGLAFLKPASLSFLIKQNIPTDTGLVVVRLDVNNNVLGQQARRAGVASAKAISTMKALAAGGRAASLGIALPGGLDCVSGQFVDSASRFALSSITAAARMVVLAVPKSVCLSYLVPADGPVPLDTFAACDRNAQFGGVYDRVPLGLSEAESSLLNRHVDCRTSRSPEFETIYVDVFKSSQGDLAGTIAPVTADPSTTESVQAARVRYEFQMSTSGPSGELGKLVKYRARILEYDAKGYSGYKGPAFPNIFLRPQPACVTFFNNGFPEAATQTCDFKPQPIMVRTVLNGITSEYDWSEWAEMPVKFDWTNKPESKYDMAFFSLSLPYFQTRIAGTDEQFKRPGGESVGFSTNSNLGNLPGLRCDRGVAKAGTKGCVFHEAAAVLVLSKAPGSDVQEAAEHILEAQNDPDELKRAPGRFALKTGTRTFADSASMDYYSRLQRAKLKKVNGANRYASCDRSVGTSLIRSRQPEKFSASCLASSAGCQCDEYPFAATWNGAHFRPDRTSVKTISGSHNAKAGERLGAFYLSQRILDFVLFADGPYLPFDPNFPTYSEADSFWVFVK
jgi:hypothetical protein